jgi:AcrR family transcriptional regulator
LRPTTKAPSERISRRRDRTRTAILDAAEAAFIRNGYRGARMEDLAGEADVSVGSIYGHFGNKDGLYLALVDRAVELFAGYMQEAYAASDSPLEQVMAAGDAYLRFHLEHPGAFRFLAFDGVETRLPVVDDALQARVAERTGALIDAFAERIAAATAAGEAVDLDPYLTSRFLWGAWNGVVALGLRTDRLALSDEQVSACLQQARRIVVDGLTAAAFRDADGRSRARLVSSVPGATSRTRPRATPGSP